jgi:hypothetical protein
MSQVELQLVRRTIPAFLGHAGFWLAQAGATLLKVKRRIGREDWVRATEMLRLDAETLRMLLKIGTNKALANPYRINSLPASLAALCALSQLDRATIERGISTRAIRPQMTEAQAKEFIKNPPRQAPLLPPTPTAPFDAQREASEFTQQVLDHLRKWPTEQRDRAAELLVSLADQIGAGIRPEELGRLVESSSGAFTYQQPSQAAPGAEKPKLTPL